MMFDESLQDNDSVLRPGDRFGPFQIMRLISKCLTGEFYSATHTATGEARCFVRVPEVMEKMPQLKEKLDGLMEKHNALGEAPGVVRFTGYERLEGRLALFTEAQEYQSVATLLRNEFERAVEGLTPMLDEDLPEDVRLQSASPFPQIVPVRMPTEQAQKILKETAQAIKVAHTNGLHHYNLVAENVLLDQAGAVCILGMGLVEILDEETFQTLASESIPPLREGEPVHLTLQVNDLFPLEVERGETFDSHSDIFGYGVLTYYLFTGTRPQAPYTPVSAQVEDLPIGWDIVIQRCLQGEKARRYPTAGALLKDVERVDSLTEATAAKDARQQPAGGSKPSPIILLGGFAVVLALVGALYFLVFSGGGSSSAASGGPSGPRVALAPAGQEPDLRIRVTPAEAVVRFSGAAEGSLSAQDGLLNVVGPDGNYRLRISAPLYVAEGQLVEITEELQELEVALEPAWATLEVESQPDAYVAIASADGSLRHLGVTDAEGILRLEQRLFVSTYTLVVDKPGYARSELPVELSPADVTRLSVPLQALAMSVTLTTQPEGAEVFLDGRLLGVTPFTTRELPLAESILLEARLDRFHPLRMPLTLEPGGESELHLGALEPITGRIFPQVTLLGEAPTESQQAELTFLLDDEAASEETLTTGVQIGVRELTVQHPQYQAQTLSLEVQEGMTEQPIIDLTPLPGRLTLQLEPAGVDYILRIDGENRSAAEAPFAVPTRRPVTLELFTRDYLTESQAIELEPGESFEWELTLRAIPPPQPGQPYTVPVLGQTFVPVPAGLVVMGSPPQEAQRRPNESPRTEVTLTDPFWLSQYEVTQAEFERLVRSNPSVYKGDNRPVENVTYEEAERYCRNLTFIEKQAGRLPEGYVYRLPTEAEWEHACNPNSQTPFHFGETADTSQGNFVGEYPTEFRTADLEEDAYGTEPVGSYSPNALGLYDMHGNVAEWTFGIYNDRYPALPRTNYAGADRGDDRAVRGGGWSDPAHRCRTAARERQNPTTRAAHVGFRVALAIELDPGR